VIVFFQTLENQEIELLIDSCDANCSLRFADVIKLVKMDRTGANVIKLFCGRNLRTVLGPHSFIFFVTNKLERYITLS
jgi:hypothetical protein